MLARKVLSSECWRLRRLNLKRLPRPWPINAGLCRGSWCHSHGAHATTGSKRRESRHRTNERLANSDYIGLLKEAAEPFPILFVAEGLNVRSQLSWTIVDCPHRVRSIPQEIQDGLLKLDAIACHGREVTPKLMPQNHAISLQPTPRQRNHLSSSLVHFHGLR